MYPLMACIDLSSPLPSCSLQISKTTDASATVSEYKYNLEFTFPKIDLFLITVCQSVH